MEAKHKGILRKYRVELCSQLLVDGLLVQYLYQEGILSESQLEEINAQNTRGKKVMKLLDILPTRGPRAFGKFLESLHDFPWIREKLSEAENQENLGIPEEWIPSIPEHILNSTPTDKQLNKIASRLGPEWERLAVDLGLSQANIYRCKEDHLNNNHSQIMAAFVLWKQQSGRKATFQCLLEALKAAEVDLSVLDHIV
nr:PREDICTED: death domain-containing protein CRADD [Latimeria chalumnae]|eukprot:XP_014350897.1 PREDICTED: death domain-containing protein CRADD [Latimeria chalumnae]